MIQSFTIWDRFYHSNIENLFELFLHNNGTTKIRKPLETTTNGGCSIDDPSPKPSRTLLAKDFNQGN